MSTGPSIPQALPGLQMQPEPTGVRLQVSQSPPKKQVSIMQGGPQADRYKWGEMGPL